MKNLIFIDDINLPAIISAGSNRTLSITFSPVYYGYHGAKLFVIFDEIDEAACISLYGNGANPPIFSVDRLEVHFGDVNIDETSPPQSIDIMNTTNTGQNVSNGIYFYQMKTDDFVQTRKMILIK